MNAASAAAGAFTAVFLAELPDKTMTATLVMTTRFRRPLAVWTGVAAAFAVHVTLAVLVGGVLSRLPTTPVNTAVAVLFAAGAVLLWRDTGEDTPEQGAGVALGFAGIAARAFGVILLAEFGDLTQLTTAGLAARTGQPTAVAVGALAALWSVAAIGATVGRQLERRLPVRLVRRIAAVVFAALSVATAVDLLT